MAVVTTREYVKEWTSTTIYGKDDTMERRINSYSNTKYDENHDGVEEHENGLISEQKNEVVTVSTTELINTDGSRPIYSRIYQYINNIVPEHPIMLDKQVLEYFKTDDGREVVTSAKTIFNGEVTKSEVFEYDEDYNLVMSVTSDSIIKITSYYNKNHKAVRTVQENILTKETVVTESTYNSRGDIIRTKVNGKVTYEANYGYNEDESKYIVMTEVDYDNNTTTLTNFNVFGFVESVYVNGILTRKEEYDTNGKKIATTYYRFDGHEKYEYSYELTDHNTEIETVKYTKYTVESCGNCKTRKETYTREYLIVDDIQYPIKEVSRRECSIDTILYEYDDEMRITSVKKYYEIDGITEEHLSEETTNTFGENNASKVQINYDDKGNITKKLVIEETYDDKDRRIKHHRQETKYYTTDTE